MRKPLGAAVFAEGCRERKLDVLAFGERVFGVDDDPAAEGSPVLCKAGDEIVGDEGTDSLDRECVKYTTLASDPPTSTAICETASTWFGR